MKVPFIDLRTQHNALKAELDQAFTRVMERADFALGEDVVRFEDEFAEYCGTQSAIGVDCGLSALELSLRAFEIGPGDEVIIPAHTFIATAAAVSFTGATPVFVDVEQSTQNIDVSQIEGAITQRTKAIIPVHLFGLPAEMESILSLARIYGLVIIEDACQAHGAQYEGKRVGSLGHAAAFSFYPTKNLGGCGDAGIVVTNDPSVTDKVRAMRNCGQRTKYLHELPPFNHRMDTIQAALLRVKLRHLDEWLERRRAHAGLYSRLLEGNGVITPVQASNSTHVFHLYVVRTPNRNALQVYLREHDIGTMVHYPIPIHLQPFYTENGSRQGQYPVSEKLCSEVLSLPLFPEMTTEQVQYVAETVLEFCETIAHD